MYVYMCVYIHTVCYIVRFGPPGRAASASWGAGAVGAHNTRERANTHTKHTRTQVLGSPSEEAMEFVTSDKARRYLRSLPRCEAQSLRELYPEADPQVHARHSVSARALCVCVCVCCVHVVVWAVPGLRAMRACVRRTSV